MKIFKILAIVSFFIIFSGIAIATDYTIDGDTVLIDDSNVYLSAYPHTLSESGYVYFNFSSKELTGVYDLCFGFNTLECVPTIAEKKIINNWIDITNSFQTVEYDYDNLNTWYCLKGIPITKNINYTIRVYYEINEISIGGKYGVALKPVSESFEQAIVNDNFWYLDPWWSGDWQRRIPITLTGNTSGAQTDYQILLNVTYDSDMQANFDDLRFTNDTHQIDAWLESNTTTHALIWVEFLSTPANGVEQTYYMYYGNSDAASVWSGANTFIDFSDFDDLTGWTQQAGTWTTLGGVMSSPTSANGCLRRDTVISESSYLIDFKMKMMSARMMLLAEANSPIITSASTMLMPKTNTNELKIYDDFSTVQTQSITLNTATWYIAQIKIETDLNVGKIFDSSRTLLATTPTLTQNSAGTGNYFGFYENGDDYDIDWILVRKYAANPATYAFGAEEQVLFIPPNPINLQNTTANFWINHTWQPGTGNITDSYNVSVNDIWYNDTIVLYYNDTYLPYEWQNITVWAYNNSALGSHSLNSISQNTQLIPDMPKITLFSQSTTQLFTNYTGIVSSSYIIESQTSAINFSSISFLMGMNYTLTNDYHSHLKIPANSIASDGIYRAHNRNTSPYMHWESNNTITEGNVWQWGGGTYDDHWIVSEAINATHTYINVTGIASNIFPSMFYLGRNAMYAAPKTTVEINKGQGVIIKIWDLEQLRGRTHDYYISLYFDTQIETTPSDTIDIWYCNDSFDPNTDDPCLVCDYKDSWSSDRWMNHDAWQPHNNVSYSAPLTLSANISSCSCPPTEINYIYLQSNTVTPKSYLLNVTNSDPGICNITYAETNTMWLRNELAGTNTPYAYTPSVYQTFVRDYLEFTHHLYVANDDDYWAHSTYNNISIGVSNILPTYCRFNYFWWDSTTDYNMINSYDQSFWINITYGFDPDSDEDLTHVLSLYDQDKVFVAEINSSLSGSLNDEDIFFDISDYKNNQFYLFKIVSTDNEGTTSAAWSQIFYIPSEGLFFKIPPSLQQIPDALIIIKNKFINIIPFIIAIILFAGFGLTIIMITSKIKRW